MNIKPQDWHNTRYVDYIPEHFTTFKLSSTIQRINLLKWIEQNTTGRYAIGSKIEKIKGAVGSSLIREEQNIGFEEPSDATMFTLFYK